MRARPLVTILDPKLSGDEFGVHSMSDDVSDIYSINSLKINYVLFINKKCLLSHNVISIKE